MIPRETREENETKSKLVVIDIRPLFKFIQKRNRTGGKPIVQLNRP